MGYTHYWYRKSDANSANQYAELRMDTSRIITTAIQQGIVMRGPFGTGQPEFSEERFAFNGDSNEDLYHETFAWRREVRMREHEMEDGEAFDFCKTAYKPYDAVVTAVLIRAKEIYGNGVRLVSDGEWEDWEPGRSLYELTFGRPPRYSMDSELEV